ncbi:MAG: methylenetetrahydrofolate reductase [Stappiaceae bacterium]
MRKGPLPASIEASPTQIVEKSELFLSVPQGSRIYLTDLGNCPDPVIVNAARQIRDMGCIAVPHLAARRFASQEAFETRIKALAAEAGVNEALVIAGESSSPGPLASSLAMLQTGLFDALGFKHIAVAGHPEGSPDVPSAVIYDYLLHKHSFARNSDAEFRIVTQFGFDPEKVIAWLGELESFGNEFPVHIGIAGPAKVSTLLKFAAIAGVGNSINFLKKRSGSMLTMLAGYDPDDVVNRLEDHVALNAQSQLAQIHVYPFGGVRKSGEWLVQRGSWALGSEGHTTGEHAPFLKKEVIE